MSSGITLKEALEFITQESHNIKDMVTKGIVDAILLSDSYSEYISDPTNDEIIYMFVNNVITFKNKFLVSNTETLFNTWKALENNLEDAIHTLMDNGAAIVQNPCILSQEDLLRWTDITAKNIDNINSIMDEVKKVANETHAVITANVTRHGV